ncbi:SAM-dependent methyltransferase [Christiangramia forsetii]|uniref:Uroporphyrin-III C/tetrapyrrole (Corrin/Porphyrin) methyltransferase n=2 Tax=Christiangramia forsetii TaxID=411153 RepID=A0LZ11_CHRFK|nr:SAM-dependent methyltransferase [Christiangramia forsetii]GGG37134.1 S-adenosylmethionine-dependent methyltransferase [Christiangramia forsetii]CAL65606.1 uroporphyrin-III C/tetrapyrrole (Corrin/Porphyrin) methyltransferase [Christiangramia forsetii KT0803]
MTSGNKDYGKLYLIPVSLGDSNPEKVFPPMNSRIIDGIEDFIVENEKSARRFIKQILPEKSQQSLKLKTLNKFTEESEIPTFLNAAKDGKNIGLLSEAGCPGVADPGAEIVKLAHRYNIQVVPLIGPSSILLAMMASGMNGQSFTFHGYLPIDKKDRKHEIKQLERISTEKNQAQIFIETPYRNMKFLEDLIQNLHPTTRICVACDLTLESEFIKTATASEWKNIKADLHKRPAIFIIQRDL